MLLSSSTSALQFASIECNFGIVNVDVDHAWTAFNIECVVPAMLKNEIEPLSRRPWCVAYCTIHFSFLCEISCIFQFVVEKCLYTEMMRCSDGLQHRIVLDVKAKAQWYLFPQLSLLFLLEAVVNVKVRCAWIEYANHCLKWTRKFCRELKLWLSLKWLARAALRICLHFEISIPFRPSASIITASSIILYRNSINWEIGVLVCSIV